MSGHKEDRPNHYFEDSLGDPATCTEDHNHPDDLAPPERAEGLREYLRRIGVGYDIRTLRSGNKVVQIRLDRLKVAEGGEWE